MQESPAPRSDVPVEMALGATIGALLLCSAISMVVRRQRSKATSSPVGRPEQWQSRSQEHLAEEVKPE